MKTLQAISTLALLIVACGAEDIMSASPLLLIAAVLIPCAVILATREAA